MTHRLHLIPLRVLFLLCLYTTAYGQGNWSQVGLTINGEAAMDNAGTALSMAGNGAVLAIGAPFNAGGGNGKGQVRVYEKNGTAWTQRGTDIDGTLDNEAFGRAVSIDSAGTTFVAGGPYNDAGFGGFSNSGYARVFTWNGTAWTQKGTDLLADASGDNFGYSVSISADGSTIAIGAPSNAGGGTMRGSVKIFRWNGSAWAQLGTKINGEGDYNVFGNSVSLDGTGNTVAIGAPFNAGNGTDAGHARVYSWNGTTWTQVGADIDGLADSDYLGYAVSLSSNGTTLAIGAPQDMMNGGYGYARVFTWNATSWVQKGSTVSGILDLDQFGASLELAKDGNSLIVGASGNVTGNENGRAEVYIWNTTDWILKGDTLHGQNAGDAFGTAVSLSYDGKVIAVGAGGESGSAMFSGATRIFDFCSPSANNISVTICGTQYISPSGNHTWTTGGTYYDTIPNAIGCDSVITVQLSINALPVVDLGSDQILCADSIVLNAANAGARFSWNTSDTTQTLVVKTSGSYIARVNNNGCISSDTINIYIQAPGRSNITLSVCDTQYVSPSAKYTWKTDGTYLDTIPASTGCDSIITIQLTLHSVPLVNLGNDVNMCGDSIVLDAANSGAHFTWNTNDTLQTLVVKTSGNYIVQVNNNGCMASDTIGITIKHPTTSTVPVSACGTQYTSPSTKYTWTTDGAYMDTIPNASGCDSVITVQLTLHPYPTVNLGNDTTLCADSIVLDAGNINSDALAIWSTGDSAQTLVVKTSGFYAVAVIRNGCIAFDNMNVQIGHATASTVALTFCGAQYISPSTKHTWTTDGTYIDTIPNVGGCDSIITIQLTLKPSPVVNLGNDVMAPCTDSSVTLDAGNAGMGYSYVWNNTGDDTTQTLVVKTSGTYFVQVSAPNGCKASDTISVTITNLSMQVSRSGFVFTVKDSGAIYSWLNYNNNAQPIPGANSQSYSATGCVGDSITIAAIVNKNGCIDTSDYIPFKLPFVRIGEEVGVSAVASSMSFSSDGSAIAVVGNIGASIKVYKRNNTILEQRGSDITVSGWTNKFMAISGNGTTLIGSWYLPGMEPSQVKVYQWNGADWIAKGNGFNGEPGSYMPVAISSDGNTIAYGDAATFPDGMVNVYQWNAGTSVWVLKGATINSSMYQFGASIALSADGNTLAVGAPSAYVNDLSYAGQVIIYQWNASTNVWVLKGAEINGTGKSDYWGKSIGLSADGNTVVSGGIRKGIDSIAYVKVLEYAGGSWVQKGPEILSIQSTDVNYNKLLLAISADGNRILNSNIGNNHAKKLVWSNGNWVQIGSDILTGNDMSYIAMEANGSTIGLGYGSHASLYKECTDNSLVVIPVGIDEVKNNSNAVYPIMLYPNPSTGLFTVKVDGGETINKVEVYNVMGQVVSSVEVSKHMSETTVDISHVPEGIYFVKVTGEHGQKTLRMLLQQ